MKQKTVFCSMFLVLWSCLLLFTSQGPDFVMAREPQFAQILKSGVLLYREPMISADSDNVFFILEKTYFVELIENANEAFYKARYIDSVGYVRKSDVQCVAGIPQRPFADRVGFRVYAPEGLNLRERPKSELFNIVTTVPYLETNLQYFGVAEGEEAVPYKGAKWYYCKYVKNGEIMFGYLYSVFCDQLTTIAPNAEILEYISEPEFDLINSGGESGDAINDLSTAKTVLIIVGVSLPCLLILYLLFKPTRITVKALQTKKHAASDSKPKYRKLKKHRGQDFYEYDE